MKLNPYDTIIKLWNYVKEDIKTSTQIEDEVWRADVKEWISGTLEWLNNPTVLPPSYTLEEIFAATIVAQGYPMLMNTLKPRHANRTIHNFLEYILRSEGKVDISCIPEDGNLSTERKVPHPACTKRIVDEFMDFSKPVRDITFYQICADLIRKDIDHNFCPHFTALLSCGYMFDHSITFPKDIRLCDNCMDLYYSSAVTKHRSMSLEYRADVIQGFVWLRRTIKAIFLRNELDKTTDNIRKEVSFVLWYFALIKVHRMENNHDVVDGLVKICTDRLRKRVEQKELK